MAKECAYCKTKPAKLVRSKNLKPACWECFFEQFENEIHETIISSQMFKKGEKIALGASGGKDSTVLIHVLKHLNEKYQYGLELILLSIDEGIKGESSLIARLPRRLSGDREEEHDGLWPAFDDHSLQRTLWLDHG